MLRPLELAAMRAAALSAMPDTATVQRYSAQSGQWQTVGTSACRVIPKRAVARDANGQLQGITLWNMLTPHDANIVVDDRLTVGGRVYNVTGTDAGRSEAVAMVVQCSRA